MVAGYGGISSGSTVRSNSTSKSKFTMPICRIPVIVTVLPDDMPPYPATTQQRVSQMQIGQLQPGQTLQASVDPANPAAIWLDLGSAS